MQAVARAGGFESSLRTGFFVASPPAEAHYELLDRYLAVVFRLLESLATVEEAELALKEYLPLHRQHQLPSHLERMLWQLLEAKRERDSTGE